MQNLQHAEAALAYNKKSRELYGDDGKINIVKPPKLGEQQEGEQA